MEYKPAARYIIKNQQIASITWIITFRTKHLFSGEKNLLAEFFLMKNNIHACDSLIYHAEVLITLYGEYSPPTYGHKRKPYKYNKPVEDSFSNKKVKPKVEIRELLKKHFTNGICKVNPYLCFRCIASFRNVHISDLSKDNKFPTRDLYITSSLISPSAFSSMSNIFHP